MQKLTVDTIQTHFVFPENSERQLASTIFIYQLMSNKSQMSKLQQHLFICQTQHCMIPTALVSVLQFFLANNTQMLQRHHEQYLSVACNFTFIIQIRFLWLIIKVVYDWLLHCHFTNITCKLEIHNKKESYHYDIITPSCDM